MRTLSIDPAVFEIAPTYCRGVILVSRFENQASNKRVKKPLNKLVQELMGKNKASDAYVRAWDEVHRGFGSDPEKNPPSIKALLCRIDKGGGLPYINTLVALSNFISLKYLIPSGAESVVKTKGNLHLGVAKGDEVFVPLGSDEIQHPEPGEIIYFSDEDKQVLCRRMNWRASEILKITEDTTQTIINVEGVGIIPRSHVQAAHEELAQLLKEHCSAELKMEFLNKENPSTGFNF